MTYITGCIYRYGPLGEELEIEVRITGSYSPPVQGRSYGPPEDCYPDEPGGCEDIAALVELPPREGQRKARWEAIPLTDEEVEHFAPRLDEEAADDAYDRYVDAMEARGEMDREDR